MNDVPLNDVPPNDVSANDVLWTPSADRIAAHPMTRFAEKVGAPGAASRDYAALHRWSVDRQDEFWSLLWDWAGVVGHKGERVFVPQPDGAPIHEARYFPDARVNFAENLLAPREGRGEYAIVFRREDGETEHVTWEALRARVADHQADMRAAGIGVGDRVAAMLPNCPAAVALMLAATSLGAVWSSCSPDFGERGVVDRFGQIRPKLFLACDGYVYAGKRIDLAERLALIAPKLGCRTVIVPFLHDGERAAKAAGAETYAAFATGTAGGEPTFERLPFDHPLYILFSSGTTGAPKCIVHRAGGALLQHHKEHRLHTGLGPGDRTFWFTTLGWMMWNWLVSSLAVGATLMLYDGSPFHGPDGEDPDTVFRFAEEEAFTLFGTSAKFIDAQRNAGRRPIDHFPMASVRSIASTGSPLSPENFRYAYEGIHADQHLASVSGGTDICACFVTCVPWEPVRVGEIQGPALAMASDVWNDEAHPVAGEKGELVCAAPFPSMPLGFLDDPGDERYHDSYFRRFPGVWCHGDYAEWTLRPDGTRGGMVIHGRSDATLNPGGVRIGTAEIYNVVEGMDAVEEALCIGQAWQHDTRVVLFVRLGAGRTLDADLERDIRAAVRSGASPRHVPAVIAQVADIPRTKSGKITELAVRDVVEGRPVKNREALANPEALDLFRDHPALA